MYWEVYLLKYPTKAGRLFPRRFGLTKNASLPRRVPLKPCSFRKPCLHKEFSGIFLYFSDWCISSDNHEFLSVPKLPFNWYIFLGFHFSAALCFEGPTAAAAGGASTAPTKGLSRVVDDDSDKPQPSYIFTHVLRTRPVGGLICICVDDFLIYLVSMAYRLIYLPTQHFSSGFGFLGINPARADESNHLVT